MFAWVGSTFDAILSNYVLGVVSSLMAAITPIALAAMTVWVAFFGWAVLRNEVPETVPTFVWKVFKIGLVLVFALQSGVYISNVSDTANALAMGVASTFLPADVEPGTISSPYALLDKFMDGAISQVADIMKDASVFRMDLVLAGCTFTFGTVLFLCMALFVVTLAKVFLTFVIAIGPLFILCLAWRPTARFFDSWLSMVLNAVVLTWFAFFALGLSTYMGNGIFKAIAEGGGFLGSNFNVLGESIRYCVLMIMMAIICFQAPSLASALTGGAAIQQGIQMIQNVMMVSRRRPGQTTATGTAAGTAAGGVIRAGTGMAQSAATAAASTGRYAGSMARKGYGAARSAAYRLAAMRGRS